MPRQTPGGALLLRKQGGWIGLLSRRLQSASPGYRAVRKPWTTGASPPPPEGAGEGRGDDEAIVKGVS